MTTSGTTDPTSNAEELDSSASQDSSSYQDVYLQLQQGNSDTSEILRIAYIIEQFLNSLATREPNPILDREITLANKLATRLQNVVKLYTNALLKLDLADDKLTPTELAIMREFDSKYGNYALNWYNASRNQLVKIAIEKAAESASAFRGILFNSVHDIDLLEEIKKQIDSDDGLVKTIIDERLATLSNRARDTVVALDEKVRLSVQQQGEQENDSEAEVDTADTDDGSRL